jgi:hypothetical protein
VGRVGHDPNGFVPSGSLVAFSAFALDTLPK